MPLYSYKCECGKEVEVFRSMDSRNDPMQCECGKDMTLEVANRIGFFCAYSPGHPRWFRGKRERGSIKQQKQQKKEE